MDDRTLFDVSQLAGALIICIPLFIFAVRLFSKKALVVSGLRTAITIGLVLFTATLVMLLIQDLRFEPSYSLLIPSIIIFFIPGIFLRNLIAVFNMEELTLYGSVKNVLQRSGIKFVESSNGFRLVDTSTSLEFVPAGYVGSCYIRCAGKPPSNFVPELQNEVRQIKATKISRFGLMIFFFGLFYLSTNLPNSFLDNGMGLSSIPYGRPLTPGEELLSRTILLEPIGFMLWAVAGVVLGIRLLNRRSLILASWWFAVLFSPPFLVLALRAIGSQFVYGFDLSDSIYALFSLFFIFIVFEFGRMYYIFNISEDDLFEILEEVFSRHDLAFMKSRIRIPIGSENNYVTLSRSGWAAATIRVDPKSLPHHSEFMSDLRTTLSKRQLAGFPKTGLLILLVSVGFLALWFVPFALDSIFSLITK